MSSNDVHMLCDGIAHESGIYKNSVLCVPYYSSRATVNENGYYSIDACPFHCISLPCTAWLTIPKYQIQWGVDSLKYIHGIYERVLEWDSGIPRTHSRHSSTVRNPYYPRHCSIFVTLTSYMETPSIVSHLSFVLRSVTSFLACGPVISLSFKWYMTSITPSCPSSLLVPAYSAKMLKYSSSTFTLAYKKLFNNIQKIVREYNNSK